MFLTNQFEVDYDAMEYFTDDVPDTRSLYPCTIKLAECNSLPSCGSVIGYGFPENDAVKDSRQFFFLDWF